jgi:putative FmdB family regulatory protein
VPTYQYACTDCGDRSEVVQRFTDDPLTVCNVCSGKLRKLFSPVGIVFKGSGFYRTDSRNGSSKVGADKESASSNGSSGSDGSSSSGSDSKNGSSTPGSDSSTPGSDSSTSKPAKSGSEKKSSSVGATSG